MCEEQLRSDCDRIAHMADVWTGHHGFLRTFLDHCRAVWLAAQQGPRTGVHRAVFKQQRRSEYLFEVTLR